MEYYDISPEVSEETAVFPGDAAYRREVSLAFAKGDHLDLSSIRTTVHVGAHADAPSHYHAEGQSIDQRSLRYYWGPCQVLSTHAPRGQRILPAHLSLSKVTAERILLKTGSFPDPKRFNQDFNSLSPELVEALAAGGVILVGIDTPSVDPWDSKALEAHQAAFRHDLALLEGLDLARVPDGAYQLAALPLRLKGADASPVRAVLAKA